MDKNKIMVKGAGEAKPLVWLTSMVDLFSPGSILELGHCQEITRFISSSLCIIITTYFLCTGAIELSILSKHYQTEIAVVDTESGRIDRFGKTFNFS